ncbi:hypothetical protein [Pedobacter kyonggii]|uniref:Uncharacterized protein n=1 Tax=Pedobacter kyonggii TaxID=1926871 RepID=A0A4Q9HGM1_9SPHI|nr:hypothetical protein [Pedobacter kyonggii]TBO44265.1 hypothetical protein EYS08_02850 [Pedobacter kyonggii]
MAKKNKTMKVHGYDSAQNEVEITREQPFSDVSTGKHYGMPVTPEAFLNMIRRFKDQVQNPDPKNPFKDVLWVEFSKASIFRILSQEDCEYIRFYMAIPDESSGKASLSLQGVKADGSTIKREILESIAQQMETDSTAEDQTLTMQREDLPPPVEEKGNEGATLHGEPVKSLNAFISKPEWSFQNKSFSAFISDLHDFQVEKF